MWLTRPATLQYVVIDGQRTLIGAGYICGTVHTRRQHRGSLGPDVSWHTHGPFLFGDKRLDVQAWAERCRAPHASDLAGLSANNGSDRQYSGA